MTAALQEEGTTSNRYTILGRLAGGGMADIYLAMARSVAGVERHVVLKRVLQERGRDPQFAKMFLDEARLAAQLQHPNIAQVLDVGILAGSYFFTMEYVHGKDLRAILQNLSASKKQMPINYALYVAIGALSALHHAHERTSPTGVPLSVVHRDVSPSNVMVSYEGAIKLLDFGVAKATQRAEETRTGTIKGKIAYLSPEQCRTGPIDRRSDIFSLGILLYEMLCCRRLYRYESDFMTMNAIVNEPTPSIALTRGDVSAALDAAVLKALEKDPAKRYATAAEFLETLEQIAETDRLVLSAAGMGRMMREMFGDRKEPWKELPEPPEDTKMTITGESLASLGTPNPADRALAEQLARAPEIKSTSEAKTVAELPAVQALPSLPLPPQLQAQARSSWPRIIAVSLACITVVLVVVLIAKSGSKEAPPPSTPPVAAAAVVAIDAPAAPDAPAAVPVDAPARTIASVMASGDWVAALQLCVAADAPTDEERKSCGIAACNAKQRGIALDFYAAAPAAAKPAIERACKLAGIAVRPAQTQTQTQTQPPKKDPCEIDPLSCQK